MNSSDRAPKRSAGRHMLHGSIWMISLRWTIRLIGLMSTIILARLLSPADFGIVAMAMIVVGMLEILSQSGQKLAIIRLENPTREDYDTAWTISTLVGLTIGICILAIAPLTQVYFHEPRTVPVMQCLALRSVIGGMENIGVVDFRRNIRFDRFFWYNAFPKMFSFCVTVGLAWYLRNYWALVAGILSGQLATTLLSYIIHPYRPNLSLARISKLGAFSMWTLVKTFGGYLNNQIDQIVIGGVAGTSSMGRYAVASDISASPSREVNEPMVTVLYPVMAKMQGNLPELRALYLRTLGWSAIVCASTSVGVTLVAPEMVKLILGSKWLDVEPLIGWLALSAGALGLCTSAYVMFDVTGKPHLGARMQWVRVLLLACAIVPVGYLTHNLTAIAETRLVVTSIFLPTLFLAAGREIDLGVRHYVSTLWRPLVSAAIMALIVRLADIAVPLHDYAKLVFDIAVGGTAFIASLVGLWLFSGHPNSAEKDVFEILRNAPKILLTRLSAFRRGLSSPTDR